MLIEEVKKDQHIRWKANRITKSWDTYGVITKVDWENERVYILTFDDHKETDICLNGDAIQYEIRVADKDEVFEYLNSRNNELNEKYIEINDEILALQTKITAITNNKEIICELILQMGNQKTTLNQGDRIKYEYENGTVKFGYFHRYGETKENAIVIFDNSGLGFVNEDKIIKV